jgi:hypothetical protein
MPRLRNEIILTRYRIMATESGVFPKTVTDAELLETARGKTYAEKLDNLEKLLMLVAPGYWEKRGV